MRAATIKHKPSGVRKISVDQQAENLIQVPYINNYGSREFAPGLISHSDPPSSSLEAFTTLLFVFCYVICYTRFQSGKKLHMSKRI